MIYSLNTEVFKFHSYDIVNINKAIERFGISVTERNGYYSVERDNKHIIINDGDFIVVSPSAEISSSSGLPVYEFKAYTNDRFIRLMEMNNQLKELTDKVFSYNPKKDPRDPIFGKHNIRKNGEKKMDKITYEECKKMVSHMEDSFKSDVFGVEKENGKVEGILAASCLNMLHFMYLWFPVILALIITFIMTKMNVEKANEELKSRRLKG